MCQHGDGGDDGRGHERGGYESRHADRSAPSPAPQASPCDQKSRRGPKRNRYAALKEHCVSDAMLPAEDHSRRLAPCAEAIPGNALASLVPVRERLQSFTEVWRRLQLREQPVIGSGKRSSHTADCGMTAQGG